MTVKPAVQQSKVVVEEAGNHEEDWGAEEGYEDYEEEYEGADIFFVILTF